MICYSLRMSDFSKTVGGIVAVFAGVWLFGTLIQGVAPVVYLLMYLAVPAVGLLGVTVGGWGLWAAVTDGPREGYPSVAASLFYLAFGSFMLWVALRAFL